MMAKHGQNHKQTNKQNVNKIDIYLTTVFMLIKLYIDLRNLMANKNLYLFVIMNQSLVVLIEKF